MYTGGCSILVSALTNVGQDISAVLGARSKQASDLFTQSTVCLNFKGCTNVQKGEHGGYHSYRGEEVRAFAEYINKTLQNDPQLLGLIPLDPNNHDQFFAALHDGVIIWFVLFLQFTDRLANCSIWTVKTNRPSIPPTSPLTLSLSITSMKT